MQLVEYSKRSITRNNTGLVAPLINCNYELMKMRLNKSVNVTEIYKTSMLEIEKFLNFVIAIIYDFKIPRF